jgi:hypothetical protein
MATPAMIQRRTRAIARLTEERRWMSEHGDNLGAYILRYGSKNDPEHYGNGGEAIYAADKAKMDEAEAEALAAIVAIREADEAAQK